MIFYHRPGSASEPVIAVVKADGSDRVTVPLPEPPRDADGEPAFLRHSPSFAADGRRFAYVRSYRFQERSEIWVATTDGREDRQLAPGYLPRWSPDGRTIAYVATGGTWLMSARSGRPVRRLWKAQAHSMDWDPGGRRLIASRDGIELFVLYRTGAPASRFISAPLSGASKTAVSGREPAWSPNGRRIAFVRRRLVPSMSAGSEQQEIWTCDADGTNARRIWKRYDGFDSDRSAPSLSWQPLPR